MAELTDEYQRANNLITMLQAQVGQLQRDNQAMQKRLKSYEDAEAVVDVPLPAWFEALRDTSNFRCRLEVIMGAATVLSFDKLHPKLHLQVREWEDPVWRVTNPEDGGGGWRGTDYVHCPKAAGVRVLDYYLMGPSGNTSTPAGDQGVDYTLVGVAYFTHKAESHVGLCHGGSMCALMDDVVGWLGFCSDGNLKPWCGFTVQIDTSLKKAVHVGSLLRLEATITERVGKRKVYIKAKLVDPMSPEVAYCTCNGLFLLK